MPAYNEEDLEKAWREYDESVIEYHQSQTHDGSLFASFNADFFWKKYWHYRGELEKQIKAKYALKPA